jgi:hypothetical protein
MKKYTLVGLVLALLYVGGSMMGQLSQSGGSGSTVAATQSGAWTVQPGNTANTTPWLTTLSQGGNAASVTAGSALKVDGSAVTQPVSGTFWQATQPVSGSVTSVPKTACGTTAYDSGMAALPTTSTAATTTSTCVNAVIFVNVTGATQTVTLTDNQGTPMAYLSGFQIPANSTLVYDLNFARLASGIKWSSTNASSVNAQIVGMQ